MRAFERFSRGDDARTRGGSGLGLAIVEAIAQAHGGAAGIAANGTGADVWISLPRPPDALTALIAVSSRAAYRRTAWSRSTPASRAEAPARAAARAAAPSRRAGLSARLRGVPRARSAARGRIDKARSGERSRASPPVAAPTTYFDQRADGFAFDDGSAVAAPASGRPDECLLSSPSRAGCRRAASARWDRRSTCLSPSGSAVDAALAVEGLFAEWEGVLSRFRPESELSRLNARPGTPVTVGPILLAAVEAASRRRARPAASSIRRSATSSSGIGYDRSFEEIGDALRVAAGGRAAAAPGGGSSSTAPRASSPCPRGAGSTWAASRRAWPSTHRSSCCRSLGIETALVSAGGDLAVLGLPPGRRAWDVLVGGDPEAPVVPLVRGALATSGTARRRWLQGDARATPSRRPRAPASPPRAGSAR